METKIFVYGSLLEDFFNYNKYLVGKVKSRSYARTKGKLYHQKEKGYPAMIKGNDFVYGELLEIDDFQNTIIELDKLEGFYGDGNPNNEYNKKLIEVELLSDGSKEQAFAYVYNCDDEEKLSNEVYLPNGCWKSYMNV